MKRHLRRLGPALLLLPLAACAAEGRIIYDEPAYGDVYYEGRTYQGGYGAPIPEGHRPPPGECRVWDPALPAGQQPPPFPC